MRSGKAVVPLATNVLANRLDSFLEAGIMQRRTYSAHENHYEYVLTDKGHELASVVIALTAWRDRWASPNGPPIILPTRGLRRSS